MAVGDGGFSTKPMGFDKNEVNEYISNLRKKMQELESEKKSYDDKVRAAVKTAEDAESKIAAAQKSGADKVAELELQLKTERRNSESLIAQIDDLKRKVKNGGGGSSSGGASTAEAERRAAEIIANANKTAKDTVASANITAQDVVAKAKQAAQDIMARAGSAGGSGGASVNIDGFMAAVKSFVDSVNRGYKTICEQAEEIAAQSSASDSADSSAAFELPDLSNITAPSADFTEAETPSFGGSSSSAGDISFEDIQSLSSNEESSDDDMMGGFTSLDEPVSDIAPNDTSDHSKPSFDMDFGADLIAQTVPSSNLSDSVDDDMLEAVRKEEEKFAVQPSGGRKDFDMESEPDDGMAAMQRMLAEAEAAFGGSGSSLEFEEPAPEPEPAPASNSWADLQKELEAMQGGAAFSEPAANDEPVMSMTEDPKVPSADDSSIWDFGSTDMGESSDDDDMSSDLFGSF